MSRFTFPDLIPRDKPAPATMSKVEAVLVLRQATRSGLGWAVLTIEQNFPDCLQTNVSCIALGDLIYAWHTREL